MLFALLTWQVAAQGPLLRTDRRLSEMMRAHSPAGWAAELCSDLGNPGVALPVLLAAMAYAYWRGRRSELPVRDALAPLLRCLAAAVAVPVVVLTMKGWLDRPGPVPGTGYGYYPSGHAATTFVAFGAAALLLLPHVRRRGLLTAVVLAVILANGCGLMWRGYHWPVDVLASWCLGVLLLTWPMVTQRSTTRAGTAPCASKPYGSSVE